uniref:RNA-binding protein MEX3B n=1 Tax=Panagrellus redivivus TaxID=6233 RepID=A0A7E4VDD1_PANRE
MMATATDPQMHQNQAEAALTTAKTSSRSSTSGEEGFVSGSSLSDMDPVDVLAQKLSAISSYASILEKPATTGNTFAHSLLSNSTSIPDRSKALMAAVATRPDHQHQRYGTMTTTDFHDSMASMSTSASSIASIQQLPGSWFYEMGPQSGDDSGANSTGSPVAELLNNDDQNAYLLRVGGLAAAIERVEVPSSEHVAEIVGRQGCKIKALRTKLDVFIRSPPRGEDPVFVITGRPDDVMEAKREIELAAEHFTQIRASRRHSQGGAPAPGHITAYVRVPLRVVGLVVGPKGATVKRIQQNTQTYIQTPSREREPVFEVTGMPHNVEAARREIEQHIFQRTGNMPITIDPSVSMQNFDSFGALSHVNTGGAPHRQTAAYPCYPGNGGGYRGAENGGYGCGSGYGMGGGASAYMRGSGNMKAYSAAGSPPPYFNDMLTRGNAGPGSNNNIVNNENAFTMGNWQPQEASVNRFYHDYLLDSPRANTFNSTSASYLGATTANANNYLSSLSSSATSRDEGLGDSPSSYTKMNSDAYRYLSSIWKDADTATSNGVENHGLAPQLASA